MPKIYMIAVLNSVVSYFLSIMSASAHLLYTDVLSHKDMLRYLKRVRTAPAEPLVLFFYGFGWQGIATTYLFSRGNSEWGTPTTAVTFSILLYYSVLMLHAVVLS